MSHFLKLSSRIINKFHIVQIVKEPVEKNYSKYIIELSNKDIFGAMLVGCGSVSTTHQHFEVYEQYDKNDFQIVSYFVDNVDRYEINK